MKRKSALRDLMYIRDEGRLGPWVHHPWSGMERCYEHSMTVMYASTSLWRVYSLDADDQRVLAEGYTVAPIAQNMAAADAWLNGLTAEDCKSKSQQIQELQDQVKYLEEQLLRAQGGF